MIKGVTKEEVAIINSILEPYKNNYEFYYYGSRVKGNFEKTSDLDVLIKGKEQMEPGTMELIKVLFDNSDLPFVVNFADYNLMDEKFYNLIKKDLVQV